MLEYPPCPECGTEMVPRDDKYDCPACGAWYYRLSFDGKGWPKERGE